MRLNHTKAVELCPPINLTLYMTSFGALLDMNHRGGFVAKLPPRCQEKIKDKYKN